MTPPKEGPVDMSIESVAPRLVALIRVEATMEEIPAAITRSYGEIFQALSGAEVAPAGPPMVIYDGPMIPGQPMSFSPAVPVDVDFDAVAPVTVVEVPGGPALIGLHQGFLLRARHRSSGDDGRGGARR